MNKIGKIGTHALVSLGNACNVKNAMNAAPRRTNVRKP